MSTRQRPPIARRLAFAPLAALSFALAGAALAESPMPAGYPGRGRIGIEVQPMTAELREFFAAPAGQGVLVVRVEEGRPAEAAELRVGDVVIAAAGEPLVRPHDLVAIVARAPAGAPIELTVVRKKRTRTIEVLPDGEPASAAALEAWHDRIGEPLPAAPAEPTAPEAAPLPAVPAAPIQPIAQPEPGAAVPLAPTAPAPQADPAPAPSR